MRHLKRAELASRRIVLRALGAEIARLHRAGYIHGDLTPYNIFVTGLQPPQFVFIDHERTRRTILSRFERPRMRNLVQLGHLDVGGVTNTDRMRVWIGYSARFIRATPADGKTPHGCDACGQNGAGQASMPR